jgi:hypothetical protein
MKTDQQNPNFGQELGPRELTASKKPPVITHTLEDFLEGQRMARAQAKRIIAGKGSGAGP